MAEMNPLLLAKVAPYAIAALIAFALAWGIQSLRLTSAKLEVKEVQQEYTAFRQEQTRIFQEARDAADKQRAESESRYEFTRSKLAKEKDAGAIWDRCVLAGRCSNPVPVNVNGVCKHASADTASINLQAAKRADETCANKLSASPGDATLANECAVTTLQLNSLQDDIESQLGYIKP